MSSTIASKSPAAAFATTILSIVRAAAARVTSFAMAQVNRWMVKQLCTSPIMSLRISASRRSDLRIAFDGPVHADPSLKLAAIARGNSMKMSVLSYAVRRAWISRPWSGGGKNDRTQA